MLLGREWSCACRPLRSSALAALIGGTVAGCWPASDSAEGLNIVAFDYASASRHGSCPQGSKSGEAGATDGLKSGSGIVYNVRTPSNYDPTFAHPLLMVYAAGGLSASRNESLTKFTTAATRNGFVVAYTAHNPMSVETVEKLAKLPNEIADRWCIDIHRVYATGHSDGGTVSTAIALLDDTRGLLAGIAPSAAGFAAKDFESFKCPSAPLPVMVMHSSWDMLFPGWGAQAAKWWAACNGCDLAKPPRPAGETCVAYQACATGGSTRYCEGSRLHGAWPGLEAEIIRFFESGGHIAPSATESLTGNETRSATRGPVGRRSGEERTVSR
jgi:polyhydroxybutyrate depolymerase